MSNKNNTAPLHSDAIENIISRKPLWIYKWGISTILAIMAICIAISFFIKLPKVSSLRLKVSALNTPIDASAPCSGEIISLPVLNDQVIKKGTILAIVKTGQADTPIVATTNGKVKYVGIIHTGQFVKTGQLLFETQRSSESYYGEMPIPKDTNDDLKPGQKLYIKLDDYPYQKYGALDGFIKYVAIDTSGKSHFIAEVYIKIPKRTDIVLSDAMMATAEITTSETTLFKFLLNSMLKTN